MGKKTDKQQTFRLKQTISNVEMSIVSEVVIFHRSRTGMTREDLEEKSGVSHSAIKAIESNSTSKPHGSTLYKLAKAFGFLTWEECRLAAKPQMVLRRNPTNDNLSPILGTIPAGHGNDHQEEVMGWMPKPPNVNDPNVYWLMIEGDSMEPKIWHGQLAIFSPMDVQQYGIENDEIYALRFSDDDTTIKRIFWVDDDEIRLVPENRQYRETSRYANEIVSAARFIGVMSLEPRQATIPIEKAVPPATVNIKSEYEPPAAPTKAARQKARPPQGRTGQKPSSS